MPHADVHGTSLYYETHGRGEPVILLHNGLGCTKSFSPQIREFSKHFRVVAYDRYGYGQSTHTSALRGNWLEHSVDELSSLLDQLDLAKVHLCGVCVGGAIALLLAARQPWRVGRIAVAGTCCYGEKEMGPRARNLYPHPERLPPGWLRELSSCHGEEYGRELYRIFYEAVEQESGYPFKGYDLRPSLAGVKSPVIVIYGDRDQLFDLEQALTMHRHLGDSRLCIIPDCGHLPNEEKPQDFNREALRFFRKHQGERSSKPR